jgi:hypothetical protein
MRSPAQPIIADGLPEPETRPKPLRDPSRDRGTLSDRGGGRCTSRETDATQALEIVGDRRCRASDAAPTAPAKTRTFNWYEAVSRTPVVVVRVVYADAKGRRRPEGPTLSVRLCHWNGVSRQPAVRAKQCRSSSNQSAAKLAALGLTDASKLTFRRWPD